MSIVVSVPYSVDHYSFVMYLEVRNCVASSSAFPFQGFFGYSWSLWFHTNFRIVCNSSVKNAGGILIEIVLNL